MFDGLPIPGSFLTPYTETINTLPVTPSVNTLLTNDTTPRLGGSVNDANVALTVGVAGRYYAATRNTNTTWLLPDGAIQPATGRRHLRRGRLRDRRRLAHRVRHHHQ